MKTTFIYHSGFAIEGESCILVFDYWMDPANAMEKFPRGARQFIERFEVRLLVPMHFNASGFQSAWRVEEFVKEKNINLWKIKEEGETIIYNKSCN